MDIKELIIAKIKENGQVNASEIIEKTGFSRAYINRFFQELRNEGKIVMFGKTRLATYGLANKEAVEKLRGKNVSFKRGYLIASLSEERVLEEIKRETGIFLNLTGNVKNVFEYSLLEMVNNAIEHSRGENLAVSVSRTQDVVSFSIQDDGVGIFENLKKKFGLPDVLSAIQQLLKGKQTTDPVNHSGQGIFFTSKMADAFTIRNSGKLVMFNNLIPDLFIQDRKTTKGTMIAFTIALGSKRTAEEVFREYTNEEYEFSKTKIKVKLYKISRNLLSRSEARRILLGLESFNEITLDFQGVESVGQSFADEIFRVWQSKNSEKKIEFENANPNVEFMIKRSI